VRSPVQEPSHATTFSRTYPAMAIEVRAVRADLRALLDGCPIAYDVMFCASELATNATVHSDSREPGGKFTVRAEVRPGVNVRVEVDDDGGPWTTPASDPDRSHGLDIIGKLATDWGITETPTGRTVWAQLDWPTT
jgi:anti-sigma regulatory factor (Ser/Thr protein kinase)